MAIRGIPDCAPLVVNSADAIDAVKRYRKCLAQYSMFPLGISLLFIVPGFTIYQDFYLRYPLSFLFMIANSLVFTFIGFKMFTNKINVNEIESKLNKLPKQDIPFKNLVNTKYGNFIQAYGILYPVLLIVGIKLAL